MMAKQVSKVATLAKLKEIAEEAGFRFTINSMCKYSDRLAVKIEPENSVYFMLKNRVLSLFETKASSKLKHNEIVDALVEPKSLTMNAIADLIMEKKLARDRIYIWKL